MCCSMPQKHNSSQLHLSTRHNLPNNYPLFFSDTQLSPSPSLNIPGLSFTCNLNWKLHISLPKTASIKLGVLSRLRQFYSPLQLLTLYRGRICPCMKCFTCLRRFHSYSSYLLLRPCCTRLASSSHPLFFPPL